MRWWNLSWAITGTLGILVLWAFSAIANYDFGLTQGTHEPRNLYFFTISSAQASGMASLAVDLLKAVLPAMIVVAWVFRGWLYVAGGVACFILCLGYSAQNSIGFALTSHARATDERAQAADQWSALRKTLETAQATRDMVPVHRPAAVVDAEIAAKKADARFTESASCSGEVRGSINFCREYRGLTAEKAAADSAVTLDDKLDRLRAQLDTRKRVSEADPMAGGAAALLGWNKENIAGGRSLWLAVLVETISAIGLALVWGVFFAAWSKKPQEAPWEANVVSAVVAGTITVPPAATPPAQAEEVFRTEEELFRIGTGQEHPLAALEADDEPRDPPPSGSRPDPLKPRLGELARREKQQIAVPGIAPAARIATIHEIKPKAKHPVKASADPEKQTVLDWIGECLTATHDRKRPPSSGDCHESLLAFCERERVAPVDQQRMTQIMTEILKPEKVRGRYPRNAKERIWPGYAVTMPISEPMRASA